MSNLKGKRVLLTDCQEFMGPAIVDRFTAKGADLISDESDLTADGACDALLESAGHVDILIANLANPAEAKSVDDMPDEIWHRAFDRLVHPMHRLVRGVVPQMKARGSGKILVIGSAAALRGMADHAAYSAARGAQVSYVQAVGTELAPFNIQINLIAQNWVDNPTYFPKEMQAHPKWDSLVRKQVPAGRLGTGEEDAALVEFLVSDECNFIVGQTIPFAGGWVN